MIKLTLISRKYVYFDLHAVRANGTAATLTGVKVALLTIGAKPTGATSWVPAELIEDEGRVLVAGAEADTYQGALVVPKPGADLWGRVDDTPEVDAVKIDQIKY